MTDDRRLTRRDRAIVLLVALAGIAVAVPGVHLLERWVDHRVAFYVSHALALALLGLAFQQWRARRRLHAAAALARLH